MLSGIQRLPRQKTLLIDKEGLHFPMEALHGHEALGESVESFDVCA